MQNVFFIVGPTGSGKSELAADVAREIGAEIVSADAFQIYEGLDLLTAKPDATTLSKVSHHLIGEVHLGDDMNVEKYRRLALAVIADIQARGHIALVVGGSGLYIKALTHGLSSLPASDPALREELNALSTGELCERLFLLDPMTAETIDRKNRYRLVRALEICLLTGQPASAQRKTWRAENSGSSRGLFLFRERDDLYARINERVERMFEDGVVNEVRQMPEPGETAARALGLREIRAHLAGEISQSDCVAALQQATRHYAKRQLTWFRRQSNFEPLNLSLLSHVKAVEWITERVFSLLR